VGLCVGCLPEPKPVVGKHLLVERDIRYVTFSRAADGEAGDDAVYVKQKPDHPPIPADIGGEPGYPADLWAVATAGGERRLLVEEIQPLFFHPFQWDARRRLIVEQLQPPAADRLYFVLGIDIATGQADNLGIDAGGSGGDFQLSPSGRWALVYRPGTDGAGVRHLAVSVDGAEIPIDAGRFVQFIGDHFYVSNGSGQLVRIDEDGSMTVVADVAMANWQIVPLAAGDLLVLSRGSVTTGETAEWQLLGTAHAGVIPGGATFYGGQVSPDGRSVAFQKVFEDERGGGGQKVEVHVLTPGETAPDQTWELPAPRSNTPTNVPLVWRPGTDELWALDNSTYPDMYPVILRPGQPPAPSPRSAVTFSVVDPSSPGLAVQDLFRAPFDGETVEIFVDGGRWWVSKDPEDPAVIRLSDASQPDQGGGIVLASAGQGIGEIAVLEPGRRLAFTLGSGEEPDNLATLDVQEGAVRIVATHVAQVSFGKDRILARSRASKAGDSSTLSMFDLRSGTESVFAENVSRMVVARPCATCLPLDPGARLLFTIQARFPFERDGIWLGTLP
jgi:hypothetical protein